MGLFMLMKDDPHCDLLLQPIHSHTLTFYANHNDRKTCVTTYINTHYEPIKQTPADVAILMIFSVLG